MNNYSRKLFIASLVLILTGLTIAFERDIYPPGDRVIYKPTSANIMSGTADGQLLYWDNTGLTWSLTDATKLKWTPGTDTLLATNISTSSITISGLTAGRVVFAGASGLLTDDADMTFSTDTLTVTQITDGTALLTGGNLTSMGNIDGSDIDITAGTGDFTTSGLGTFGSIRSDGIITIRNGFEIRFNDTGDSDYVGFKAPALTETQIWVMPAIDGNNDDIVKTDGSGVLMFVTPTSHTQLTFSMYDAEPARSSETSLDGAFLSLATAQPLNSVPTNLVVTKGTGKMVVVVNAGSDFDGEITVTGTSVDRDTGATTGADTDTLTINALTTDASDTDTNGNTRHAFTGAYITSKWFVGTVTLSTTDLTLTDVDVYHVSFEQFDDTANLVLDTFDANILTTSVNAEFDAYIYAIMVTGDKCDITREASLNVGADGETAIANKYWRLRRGNIAKSLDGTTDGTWVDVHYSNSPAFVEDVSIKVWATEIVALTLVPAGRENVIFNGEDVIFAGEQVVF